MTSTLTREKKPRIDLTAEYVRTALDYDPNTGIFVWKKRPQEHFPLGPMTAVTWNSLYAGKRARTICKGYIIMGINDYTYYAHRLAFLYMTGAWPIGEIDHANGDGTDNRWNNLRIATSSQNKANMGPPSTNTSGIKGVRYRPISGKWIARIGFNKREIWLGSFNTKEEARDAYVKAAEKYYGDFANHKQEARLAANGNQW